MDNSFFAYLQQLELLAFFSGYSLIYTATIFISGNLRSKNNLITRSITLLPFAYALVGTLYLGFELKKMYPDYSLENIKHYNQLPYLVIWGLLSILFWLPAINKKKVLSLIHSLVFFSLILKDLFLQLTAPSGDNNIIANDMKVYAASLLLNLAAFAAVILAAYLFTHRGRRISS